MPQGFDTGMVFCKKITFEVLGQFDTILLTNLNKNLIRRFKKMGNFSIINTPIIYPTRDFENKKGFLAYLLSLKKFLSTKNQQDIPESEKVIKTDENIKIEEEL